MSEEREQLYSLTLTSEEGGHLAVLRDLEYYMTDGAGWVDEDPIPMSEIVEVEAL